MIVRIPSELSPLPGCSPPSFSAGSTSSVLAGARTSLLGLLALSTVEILENWNTPFTSLLLRDIFTIFSPIGFLLPILFPGPFVGLEDLSKIDKIDFDIMTGGEKKKYGPGTFDNQSEVFVHRWLSVDLNNVFFKLSF